MDSIDLKDKIEQKCMAISMWVTIRGEAFLQAEDEKVLRIDGIVDRLIIELKGLCNGT